MKKENQLNYSKLHSGRILNLEMRFQKTVQILTIIEDFNERNLNNDLKQWEVLDIGCSAGMIDYYLADHFKSIFGIDIDKYAIEIAESEYLKKNITYKLANIDEIAINNNEKYDLVICNSVLEHVPDQEKLLKSIKLLLKPGGICFLSVPNKYTIMKEPHYDLFFLSWLPKWLSNQYLKLLKQGEYYYETPPSYKRLLKLCSDFTIYDYTIERIRFPKKYNVEFRLKENNFITKLPSQFMLFLRLISPSFVFIIRNNKFEEEFQ
jgi:ubiquinone biosynthesis O-methyltransferase